MKYILAVLRRPGCTKRRTGGCRRCLPRTMYLCAANSQCAFRTTEGRRGGSQPQKRDPPRTSAVKLFAPAGLQLILPRTTLAMNLWNIVRTYNLTLG